MKPHHNALLVILALAVVVASMSMYTVNEREQAIVLQLGQPVGTISKPGLHFKLPLVQTVVRFDRRILSVDPQPEQVVIASNDIGTAQEDVETQNIGDASGEPIIVDTFARYRIVDPLKFLKTLRSIEIANQRLESIVNSSTRDALGVTTLGRLLSPEREKIMQDIRRRVNAKTEADNLGIQVVDVRIVRADLTPELRQSTVRRMISELTERATETRAKGEERALEIRSTAEKERTVLLAEAQRDAEILRGKGDESAIRISAEAFNKDKDFYAFNRTMEAYRNALNREDTRLILSPNSGFLRYLSTAP